MILGFIYYEEHVLHSPLPEAIVEGTRTLWIVALINLISLAMLGDASPQRMVSANGVSLNEWPSLPLIGSMHLIPADVTTNNYNFYKDQRRKWGAFYSYVIPVLGKCYVTTDPVEMLKVIKAEGTHPSGGG